jgi:3-oxoacyl-[acyl-carrier-protein] synthase-3
VVVKRYAHIIGTGSDVPGKILTNSDLEKMVDTTDEWITTRTGIKRRHIASKEVCSSDLSIAASRKAIAAAGIKATDIDLILLGTVTPDFPVPSTACIVQDKLGASNAAVMDIVAACSGFVYGLSLAKAMVEASQYKNVLVIGVETLSKITNWEDRNTCVLFGDAAGAAIVHSSGKPGGILGTYLKSDGSLAHLLSITAGGTRVPIDLHNINNGDRYLKMAGPEVYKNAVRTMAEAAFEVLKRTNLSADDIDLMISHQANIRIIESTARKIKIPPEKVYINIQEYGNTSAASIPLALDEAIRTGRVKSGDIVLLVAFGGGLTWGSAIVKL